MSAAVERHPTMPSPTSFGNDVDLLTQALKKLSAARMPKKATAIEVAHWYCVIDTLLKLGRLQAPWFTADD